MLPRKNHPLGEAIRQPPDGLETSQTAAKDFLSVCKGKDDWLLTFLFTVFYLKDPRAVLELIALMELGVIRGSIDPHFINDFEPAVTETA